MIAAVVSAVLFATGVGTVPHAPAAAVVYDLVLFNLVPLLAAVVCIRAARRVPRELLAWGSLAAAWALAVIGNVSFPTVTVGGGAVPVPAVANACYLAAFPLLTVLVLVLVRVRAPSMRPTTWLDGAIGALGATAIAFTFVLDPLLQVAGHQPSVAMLVFPVADVLLLALLGATIAVLGLRGDRLLLLVALALVCKLVGDVLLVRSQLDGGYLVGGPTDLLWVVSALLCAAAATMTRPGRLEGSRADTRPRTGWRVLTFPLVCKAVCLTILGMHWGATLDVGEISALGCVIVSLVRTAVTLHEVRTLQDARRQADTDELTGLPNRRRLLAAAQQMVAEATPDRPAALLLLDLDGFKQVNDSLGHHAGDELLQQVGPRLRAALRHDDLLARLGGDEFAVLLPDIHPDAAQHLAGRLRELLLQPFLVAGVRLNIGVSIGISAAPVAAATVAELLRCADSAMYSAKTRRSGVCTYQQDPDGGADRVQAMAELRTALTSEQLSIHLQPQVDLTDGRVVGAEALIRWQHPTRGLLSPAELLPAADQAGLLRPLADRVLELALTAVTRWWSEHRVPVSVNLAAANVTDLDLPEKVAAALRRHGFPPAALTLELLEDTLAADPDRARAVLEQLRRLGIRTSIDHYGTGTGSLAQLRAIPVDQLKLDRSLTAGMDDDHRAVAIVKHTVTLADDLGLGLIAEGIEDPAISATLVQLGCHAAQGHVIAAPMPVAAFLRWLDEHEPRVQPSAGRSVDARLIS